MCERVVGLGSVFKKNFFWYDNVIFFMKCNKNFNSGVIFVVWLIFVYNEFNIN